MPDHLTRGNSQRRASTGPMLVLASMIAFASGLGAVLSPTIAAKSAM
jgi:hypothetical protein